MFHSALNDDQIDNIKEVAIAAANDEMLGSALMESSNSGDESSAPPAVRVPLQGHYLIEASAGTGKTWTLTGIVLRLLIEARRAPEHIIATTFTRAAAAEMRERINARLKDFYQLLLWLNKLQDNAANYDELFLEAKTADLPKSEVLAFQVKRKAWLSEEARRSGMEGLLSDPINEHLIAFLLDNVATYPLMEAIRRCRLVLTTLDKLFVGTLDSLAQKWLSEFSAETGFPVGIKISETEQLEIDNIIHDHVRGYHSFLNRQHPEVYQLLEHSGKMISPSDYSDTAKKSLQFFSTPIEPVDLGDGFDFKPFNEKVALLAALDLTELTPYFDSEFRKAQGFVANGKLNKNFSAIKKIQAAANAFGMAFFYHLDDLALDVFTKIPEAFLSYDEGGKIFKKGHQSERQAFCQPEAIALLKHLFDLSTQLQSYLDKIRAKLNYDLAIRVRAKLPAILESRRETTFALQMVRLNQALSGEHGARLARYIRHHYPVALIDESQDINGEQAQMISRIYLPAKTLDKNTPPKTKGKGFLLLVGDPKQAIYGFRGGDVANYNAMKRQFRPNQRMSLDVNRRSNESLITALNHWFGRPTLEINPEMSFGQSACHDALANLGQDIFYHHIRAANTEPRLSWQQPLNLADEPTSSLPSFLSPKPACLLHLPNQPEPLEDGKVFSAFELTAIHIAKLLASGQTLEGRDIKPNDIGVLSRTKSDLQQVERMLTKLGIPTFETTEVNVFDTVIAADLLALMEAMLRPQKRDLVNRVLTSHFYQFCLDDVQQMMQSLDHETTKDSENEKDKSAAYLKKRYQQFQDYLKSAAARWQQGGILAALHFALAQDPFEDKENNKADWQDFDKCFDQNSEQGILNQSVWENLAKLPSGARHLIDLRHLLDILAQFGMHIGEFELLAWFKKHIIIKTIPDWAQQQPMPTESGVQLMTIHKSKGLEFPIVYVIGMDSASKKAGGKTTLYLFDDDAPSAGALSLRRLSPTAGKFSQSAKGAADDLSDYYAKFETQENLDERRRLAYVAFTRASEQLYIVLQDASSARDIERKPLNAWLDCDSKAFSLPERLAPYWGWIDYKAVASEAKALAANNGHLNKDNQKNNGNDLAPVIESFRIDYQPAYNHLKANHFKGWAKTSFTALSRQLSAQSRALAVVDDAIEDELDLTDSLSEIHSSAYPVSDSGQIGADNIRFRFVKGANAGTFLHKVFERIDFNRPDQWSAIIDHSIRQYQLPQSYSSAEILSGQNGQRQDDKAFEDDIILEDDHQALAQSHHAILAWIADVLNAPLLASGQALASIAPHQRMAEMGFNMGLSENFTPETISALFQEFLPDEPDKHIQLTPQSADHIYRYLRGEIDLVYEFSGKYFVVDYKSNYLGDSLSNYDQSHLKIAMNKAGYWLQAAIYQVALHRFLKLRLKNYSGNETKYLGAVEYVFLRGIDGSGADAIGTAENYGRIQWQIPIELIKALDEAFGSPTAP